MAEGGVVKLVMSLSCCSMSLRYSKSEDVDEQSYAYLEDHLGTVFDGLRPEKQPIPGDYRVE